MVVSNIPKIRQCNRCKKEKVLFDFVKNKKCRYGYSYLCKECNKKADREYKRKIRKDPVVKAKHQAASRASYAKHRDARLQEKRAYYVNNKDRIKLYKKGYQERNYSDKEAFLKQTYRGIKSRCNTSDGSAKAAIYYGLELVSKEAFFKWAKQDNDFHALFETWVACDNEYRLTPSVNRIDPRKGYTLDNIEWITVSANSSAARRSGAFRNSDKRKTKLKEAVVELVLRSLEDK